MPNPWEKYQTKKPWEQFKPQEKITKTESTFGDQAYGALETIGTMLSSIPATVGGG